VHKNAIVVVIDRLGAGYLGPYGNTWLDTPALNRLASDSFVFDNMIAGAPDLSEACYAYWQGQNAAAGGDLLTADLPRLLVDAGVDATLLTDDDDIAAHPLTDGFTELHNVALPYFQQQQAQEIEQTHMANLFTSGIDWLRRANSPFLLWIHARGMAGPWDAPQAFRNAMADEEDPVPPGFVQPPSLQLGDDPDPDELLGYVQAYAGQVSLLDMCMSALLTALEETPVDGETLFCFTSPRGYPLGEHGAVGDCETALYSELLHCPLMVRTPGLTGASCRSGHLVQPADLHATLCDWFEVSAASTLKAGASLLPTIESGTTPRRDFVCATAGDETAIRTPAWHLRRNGDDYHLFAKPDDRWEVNDVADRCPQEVEELAAAIKKIQQAQQPELSEQLINPQR